ncbi:MAG: response regulator, partial [Pseudolabrys sp.]|nr:response regulator [Pseudolabrys sp.]
DLVVTDQVMPQMTGVQLAQSIAKEWPDLPVIIATGFAEMAPGSAPHVAKLAKPFSLDELAAVVGNVHAQVAQQGNVVPLRLGNGR